MFLRHAKLRPELRGYKVSSISVKEGLSVKISVLVIIIYSFLLEGKIHNQNNISRKVLKALANFHFSLQMGIGFRWLMSTSIIKNKV